MMSNRKASVYVKKNLAGILEETDSGYSFTYNSDYLDSENRFPVSLTMPLSQQRYESRTFFPFFDGLIPEGWLLEVALKAWKLDRRDRMGLLLVACKDNIGYVSVEPLV
ncbi:MAG TPA: phosphatidylinositol kinase [Spirochaetales bacterium]|nr:phosphatidylinositol kinase [Spirochaetales bacterium]